MGNVLTRSTSRAKPHPLPQPYLQRLQLGHLLIHRERKLVFRVVELFGRTRSQLPGVINRQPYLQRV